MEILEFNLKDKTADRLLVYLIVGANVYHFSMVIHWSFNKDI